ncbi:hypothetical protein DACRYDRAFT_108202 [Dacryopinax primogenitus]|uniref:Uncharacterized protein n=1 Tax=Dacryopinax primogenitus (strain DJM 731) TaxID=1858805 RepID=M5GCB5_DACPD|nr:uncharacterized protein DACRYDRAFT_108202 [Dacryopinax primogenitus]EJU01673.1 hypothetical protein DACRYDRAFT_108202 [Dacryopinax primogenitus]
MSNADFVSAPASPASTASRVPSSFFVQEKELLSNLKEVIDPWCLIIKACKKANNSVLMLKMPAVGEKVKGKQKNVLEVTGASSSKKNDACVVLTTQEVTVLKALYEMVWSKGKEGATLSIVEVQELVSLGRNDEDDDMEPEHTQAAEEDEEEEEEEEGEQAVDASTFAPPDKAFTLAELKGLWMAQCDIAEATKSLFQAEIMHTGEAGYAWGYWKQVKAHAKEDTEVKAGLALACQAKLNKAWAVQASIGQVNAVRECTKPGFKECMRRWKGRFAVHCMQAKTEVLEAAGTFVVEYRPSILKAAVLMVLGALCQILKLPLVVKFLAMIKGAGETVEEADKVVHSRAGQSPA